MEIAYFIRYKYLLVLWNCVFFFLQNTDLTSELYFLWMGNFKPIYSGK